MRAVWKKTGIFLLTFVVIYICNFFIPRLMPGDSFSYMATDAADDISLEYSKEEIAQLKAYYGQDQPLWKQFLDTVRENLHGNFGNSIYYKRPVADVIVERLPWTLYIMFTSLVLSLLIGVASALLVVRHTGIDGPVYNLMAVFSEVPSFLVGILLLFLIAARVDWIPLSGNLTPFAEYAGLSDFLQDALVHSLLPILAMVLITAPYFFFTARSAFLTVKQKKYVVNARAKGLSERQIRYKYILLNGIFPVVAAFFLRAGATIGGTLLIENVFAYPGLGKILREAVKFRDYPLIQGIFMISTFVVLVCSFVSDLINQWIRRG